jgi:16S rRNA (cytosine967-C5)-methyltransferase
VLDLCAGAGGKTLAMAAAMRNSGQIFAYDSDRHRLAPIYDRLKRNGVRNVQVRSPAPGALDDLAGKMDRVLIDAPCTGSGTWRRQPHAKWKLNADQVAQRVGEQAAILGEGTRFVKPGGTLVYITCSVLHEENGGQIAAFKAAHPEFEAVDLAPAVDALGAKDRVHLSKDGVLLTPLRTGTDGFFISLLRRTA